MAKDLDINQQIALLKQWGMTFDDEKKAREILQDTGFYRFGFYAFPFEKTYLKNCPRSRDLKAGTTFKSVYELYEFDTNLRHLLLSALDRIEVNLRARVHQIASGHCKDPLWYINSAFVAQDFINGFDANVYKGLLENPIIKKHHAKHKKDRHAPFRKVVEFMTMGNLTALYNSITDIGLKDAIAAEYGCSRGVFYNYLETIRVMRNRCAHSNCLYDIKFFKAIKNSPAGVGRADQYSLAGGLQVVKYLLGCISNNRKNDLEKAIYQLILSISSQQTRDIALKVASVTTKNEGNY